MKEGSISLVPLSGGALHLVELTFSPQAGMSWESLGEQPPAGQPEAAAGRQPDVGVQTDKELEL